MPTRTHRSILGLAAIAALAALVLWGSARQTGHAAPRADDVNVVNTPSVNVLTSPSGALWTRDAAVGQAPFQAQVIAAFQAGSTSASAAIPVPDGKRLVIENVSALASLNNGTALTYASIVTLDQGGGTQAEHYLVMHPQGSVPDVADYFTANDDLRAYAVGSIGINAFRTDSAGLGQVNVTVTGFLVDAN
jgi:hypothetical protein